MKPQSSILKRAARCAPWLACALWFAALAFTSGAQAQAPAAPGSAAVAPSAADLDRLVGRIALYPDDLVAIILPAATNPLQLVQADRFLDKRKADPKLAVDEKWDPAVKSLLNYPEVVKTMSADLDWTTELGEAVVADQGAVLEAVQAFRRRVHAAGNLKTDPKQAVVVEKEVIRIVPADPQVIYVPQYNPATVVVAGGYSSWGYYPAPYPVYYYPYPPGAAFAAGLIWGAAISAAWHGNHYVTHYGGYGSTASININRSTNINSGNVNINRPGAPSTLPAGGTSQWKPNKQPGQVSGGVGRAPAPRVGYAPAGGGIGPSAAPRPSTQPVPGGAGTPRASTQPAGGGYRGAPGAGQPSAGPGGGAFAGYGSGHQAQQDSARGAASRFSNPSAGARPAQLGAGARAVPSRAGAAPAGRAGGGGGRGRR